MIKSAEGLIGSTMSEQGKKINRRFRNLSKANPKYRHVEPIAVKQAVPGSSYKFVPSNQWDPSYHLWRFDSLEAKHKHKDTAFIKLLASPYESLPPILTQTVQDQAPAPRVKPARSKLTSQSQTLDLRDYNPKYSLIDKQSHSSVVFRKK